MDFWIGKTDLGSLVLMLFPVLLVLQAVLCLRVRSLLLRLAPLLVLGCGLLACVYLFCTSAGWDNLLWFVLGFFVLFLMAACALGWGLTGLYRLWRKRKPQRDKPRNFTGRW